MLSHSGKKIIGIFLFITILCIQCAKVMAGVQAETAVQQVKSLIQEGVVKPGAILKIVVKQGNINNYWGNGFELKKEWEAATGTLLDANVRPQASTLNFMREYRDFDITVARNREYPDLRQQGLIEDLTPYVKRFGLRLNDNQEDGFILPQLQAYFGGKIVALPMDSDIAVMYLRKDLLEDPQMGKEYQRRFQRSLELPRTWDEYLDQVAFFHNYRPGFYGSCEQREPLTAWMFWMPRYVSQALPNQQLFDDHMRPLIDSPAGVAATRSYLATLPYSPPDILKEGNDYSYTLPFYKRGDCYSYILTPAGAKLLNLESSAVKDKFITVPLPGVLHEGQLVQRTTLIYGNNLVIASGSKNKELAFLYLMWLTDPAVSARSVAVRAGFADPFRYNHLRHPAVERTYGKMALQTLHQAIGLTTFAATGLPGDTEYITALNRNLLLAAEGAISAEKAMQETSRRWEAITERYGRAGQIEYWKEQRKLYPKTLSSSDIEHRE